MKRAIPVFIAAMLVAAPFTAVAQDIAPKFRSMCATCHGPAGKGDGPAAPGLRPKPADMSSAAWQASVTDEYLRDIIRRGGAAVGKSPMMAPWGHALNEQELDAMVAYIRAMKQ